MKAIWKDSAIQFSASTNYVIEAAGQSVYSGRCDMLPDGSCEVLSNKLCQYYVYQDFPLETGVTRNENACKTFVFKDFSGNTVGSDDYICDWSYEDEVFSHNVLSNPVNGHLDPRMRLMWSVFSNNTNVCYERINDEGEEGDETQTVDFLLAIEPPFRFYRYGGEMKIPYAATVGFTLSTDYPWIFLNYDEDNIIISTTEYSGVDDRSGSFCVSWVDTDGFEQTNCYTVIQRGSRYETEYLTLDIISGGTLGWSGRTIEVSVNGGSWQTFYSRSVQAGDSLRFRGTNSVRVGTFNNRGNTTAIFNAHGNVMSLLLGDNFDIQNPTLPERGLASLFDGTSIVSASNLILPAATLSESCYASMFSGCETLVSAPVLPATTLAKSCYGAMFSGCRSLETAPVLPATAVTVQCYNYMFNNCRVLNRIECYAVYSGDTADFALAWVSNVAPTGNFIKNFEMSNWRIGIHGIPYGWADLRLGYTGATGDYSSQYTTLQILSDGVLYFKGHTNIDYTGSSLDYSSGLFFSVNGGNWRPAFSSYGGWPLSEVTTALTVSSGDTVLIKGYAGDRGSVEYSGGYVSLAPTLSGSTCSFNVYGNALSLIYGDSFRDYSQTVQYGAFLCTFEHTNVISAGNWKLPTGTCPQLGMFETFWEANMLTTAPVITFSGVYNRASFTELFYGCDLLDRVECHLSSVPDNGFARWLLGTSASGTFVKKQSATYPSSTDGIPSGWIIQNIN